MPRRNGTAALNTAITAAANTAPSTGVFYTQPGLQQAPEKQALKGVGGGDEARH